MEKSPEGSKSNHSINQGCLQFGRFSDRTPDPDTATMSARQVSQGVQTGSSDNDIRTPQRLQPESETPPQLLFSIVIATAGNWNLSLEKKRRAPATSRASNCPNCGVRYYGTNTGETGSEVYSPGSLPISSAMAENDPSTASITTVPKKVSPASCGKCSSMKRGT